MYGSATSTSYIFDTVRLIFFASKYATNVSLQLLDVDADAELLLVYRPTLHLLFVVLIAF